MFFKINLIFILSSILFLNVTRAQQDVPRIISYQGVLVDANGKPITSSPQNPVKIKFEIINSSNQLIKDIGTESAMTVVGGLFTRPLDLSGIPQNDLNQQLFLQLTVNDGTPYPPIPLYSTISALNIPDNVVTSRKIKDGEVDLQDLAAGNTPGEILKWNGTQWVRGQDEGLRSVTVEQPIEGDGTSTDPLRVTIPSGVPIGTIVAYYGEIKNTSDIPDGWLLCDGSTIPTGSDYDKLRQICQNNGHSGVTPDLRGQFLRGAGITFQSPTNNPDPDFSSRTIGSPTFKIGSVQPDAFQRHGHNFNHFVKDAWFGSARRSDWPHAVRTDGDILQSYGDMVHDPISLKGRGEINFSSETRPKNVYVNYIIKAR